MKPQHPGRTDRGRELEAMVIEILSAFFELRAVGQDQGLVTSSGAGNWGLMRLIETGGPKTVAEVARMRSVSRQYIQKLANELLDQGLIKLVENPAHRRSKLMTLTRKGKREYRRLTEAFHAFLEELAPAFDRDDLESATRTIRLLRHQLEGTE